MVSAPASEIMTLIARAPWREAVTYRETWPHEYVVVRRDGQQALLAAFCARIAHGEGVECRFFGQTRRYLFLGDHKYWTMTDCADIDLDADDYVLSRVKPLPRLPRLRRAAGRPWRARRVAGTVPDAHGDDAEQLDVHTLWAHEAVDFTPWLAANLDLLGEAIGLRLEPLEREHPVGQLWLDILAHDADADVRVAIENQLAAANLSHLGQLITYATGSDAPTAVWVAAGFRHELADALHRLNAWTRDGVRFYAVHVVQQPRAVRRQPVAGEAVHEQHWRRRQLGHALRPGGLRRERRH